MGNVGDILVISLPQMDHTVVYYQCDRFDESSRLMVRACEKELGLTSSGVSSSLSDMEAVATLLEHVRQQDTQYVFIIDNVEYLDFEESRAITTLLLRYRPANLKLVFSGRHLPFARGSIGLLPDIAWLTTQQLSFSISEFNALLECQQLTLPSAEVPSLLRKMQGWPAGRLSGSWPGVVLACQSAGAVIWVCMRCLIIFGEVIPNLAVPLRDLMCLRAVLGTFHDDLVKAVALTFMQRVICRDYWRWVCTYRRFPAVLSGSEWIRL